MDEYGFAQNPEKPNTGDGKRLQAGISDRTKLAKLLSNKLKAKIQGITPRDFVFLGRLEGCVEQWRHRDAKHGAFFIYALSDNYTVRVWDGTHLPENDVLQRMDDMIDGKAPDVETSEGLSLIHI